MKTFLAAVLVLILIVSIEASRNRIFLIYRLPRLPINQLIESPINQAVISNKATNQVSKRSNLMPLDSKAEESDRFLRAISDLLIDYIKRQNQNDTNVLEFLQPEEMKRLFDTSIRDRSTNFTQLLEDCQMTLKYVVKTGHPRFFNQLPCGLDIVSLAGQWLASTTNCNMYTYEAAPVYSLMEAELIRHMGSLIGWTNTDGTFAPGGSISNLYAMLAARYRRFPDCKLKGNGAHPQLVLFTSSDSHYSIRSAAAVAGIGTENCIKVPVDEEHRMIPSELERLILERKSAGACPFFVNATSGTTVFGSFDPLIEIADICKRYNLWMHVDAAWGGGLLLSKKHRSILQGIDLADSVTWCAHKLMGALIQCSVMLTKHQGLLAEANSMSADYLFMPDKHYDTRNDTGDKTIQCGQPNDVFKLWLMWRAKGNEGFEAQIDRLMNLAKYFTQKISTIEGFRLVHENPPFLNICFWYIPSHLRAANETVKAKELRELAPKIKGKMMERGTTMVAYQPYEDLPNFFRLIVSNPATKEEDLDFLIKELVEISDQLT